MLQDVLELPGGHPRVQGHQDAPGEGDGIVGNQQFRHVGAQERYPIPGLDPALDHLGKPLGFGSEVPIGVGAPTVDDRRLLSEHLGGALQEPQGAQRGFIGKLNCGHGESLGEGALSGDIAAYQ